MIAEDQHDRMRKACCTSVATTMCASSPATQRLLPWQVESMGRRSMLRFLGRCGAQ